MWASWQLAFTSGLQNHDRINFCCFKSPRWWFFVRAATGNWRITECTATSAIFNTVDVSFSSSPRSRAGYSRKGISARRQRLLEAIFGAACSLRCLDASLSLVCLVDGPNPAGQRSQPSHVLQSILPLWLELLSIWRVSLGNWVNLNSFFFFY